MNLTKYFNINYLKQNIKKSKGFIALLVIVVPLITVLSILFLSNSGKYIRILEVEEIVWPNLICMYIIPISLSFVLFGYIYRKSSVDFINSMPINRKSIFITNSIAGIILITLIQVLTLIFIILCNSLCSTITILPKMLLDVFINMYISYLFMFFATNLAMTISGTFLTQVVLTMLIIFLIPFSSSVLNLIPRGEDIGSVDTRIAIEDDNYIITSLEDTDYTMPYHTIFNMEYDFSNESIYKMAVLGIVYLILGTYLFGKRKMENAEESFSNEKVHLFVKALTMFPMVAILHVLRVEDSSNIFIIGLIAIYYFVYDFVVKRKIKLIKSLVAFVLSLVILQGVVIGMKNIYKPNEYNIIQKSDVAKIAIELSNNKHYLSKKIDTIYFMDNKEIIDLIYKSSNEVKKQYVVSDKEWFATTNICIGIEEKNGKKHIASVDIKGEDIYKLIELLEKDENYVKYVKSEYCQKSRISLLNEVIVEDEEKVNDEIEYAIKNMTLREIYDNYFENDTSIYLKKVYYKDHIQQEKIIPIDMNEKILKIVADNQNSLIKEKYKKYADRDNKEEVYAISYCINEGKLGYENKEFENFGNYFSYTENLIEKFIEENKNEQIDPSKKCYAIQIYMKPTFENYVYLFTNKTEEIDAIIRKEIESKSKSEYKYTKREYTDYVEDAQW